MRAQNDLALRRGFDRVAELLPSQAAALAREILPALRAEARRRQAHGSTAPGRKRQSHDQPFRTRERLAARCGFSARTLAKAIEVVEAAEKDPDRFGGIVRRMDETGNVDGAFEPCSDRARCDC